MHVVFLVLFVVLVPFFFLFWIPCLSVLALVFLFFSFISVLQLGPQSERLLQCLVEADSRLANLAELRLKNDTKQALGL
ncbi:hypothetical protein BTA51_20260 [Hahella sp. CCB-MM4]|nr:hypothetical protein BTA51_20260 [Hahella sp. CCB-MM4]